MSNRVTSTGFVWGSMLVSRFFSHQGQVTLGITTRRGWQVEITSTTTGLLRIHGPVKLNKKDREYYTAIIDGEGDE